jgi:hypothetical protein
MTPHGNLKIFVRVCLFNWRNEDLIMKYLGQIFII